LRTIPGVQSVAGHIGRAINGDQVVGIESGQIWIGLDDSSDHNTAMAAVREAMQSFPGIEAKVQFYLTGTAQRVVTGAGDPIVVRIEGAEPGILAEQAERVAKLLSSIDGISYTRIDERVMAPEIQVKVDIAAAAKFGLKPGEIRRTAATVFAGLEVGNLFEDQKVFDVVVWGAPAARRSVTDVEELLIERPGGTHVRLGDVATVNFISTPRSIDRAGVTRSIDIHAAIDGRGAAVVAEIVKAELKKIEFPFEYHAYLLDDYASAQSANWNLMLVAAAAAMLVFFLMQAAVQSWQLAFALSLSLLAAMFGGVVMILAIGGTILLGSLAGLLAVFGLAVGGGLVMVNRAGQIGAQGDAPSGSNAVSRAAAERFWPGVTSAAVTALVFAPAALAGQVAGLEILQPMAVVVIGGLVSTVLVNLFVVPAFLLHMAAKPQLQIQGEEHYALS
jgi:Cu/Ag efflux pump CusA